jgi:microcystin-dependent protein
MASTYPGAVDPLVTPPATLSGPPTHTQVHQDLRDAVLAIENTLGTNPQGVWASVKARIDGALPVGSMFMWPSVSIPINALACNGQAISRTTYSALFAVLGTLYGAGDGSTTFNVPDLRERVPVGQGISYSMGVTGGVASQTVPLPVHSHTIDHGHGGGVTQTENQLHTHGVNDPGHVHNLAGANTYAGQLIGSAGGSIQTFAGPHTQVNSAAPSAVTGISLATENASHNHNITAFAGPSGNAGTGNTMSVMQPFIAINYIIRSL